MIEHLYIVTGSSRGMGAAIAAQLLGPRHFVLGLARGSNAELARRAQQAGGACEQWQTDLAQPAEAAARLQRWMQSQDSARLRSATLINNAAMLSRIGPVEACDDAELVQAMRINLEAPVLLTAVFLRATHDWKALRRVLNISSGLGRRAMAGSATYCAAKAGMDHFSRAVALDEARHKHGARIVSLAPGVIDTDMQVQLRDANPAGFPDRGNFVKLKTDGMLSSADDAAARVLAYLHRVDFGSQPVADVRDA